MTALFRHPIRFLVLGTLTALSFGALGKLAPTDALEREWGMTLSRDLTKLPTSGRLDAKRSPWADTVSESGAPLPLDRWYHTEFAPAERFRLRAPHLDELTKMERKTRSRIANEQPSANLLDLARGRADYPVEKEIRKILASKQAARLDEWMNFGWAVAATNFREPNAVSRTVRLPTGHELDLEIGSADMKTFLSYYYGVVARERVKVHKVNRLDPAIFHVLLTNSFESNGPAMVADIDPSDKTDYRPIIAYDTDIRIASGDATASTSEKLYRVTTTVEYARRRLPQKQPYGFYNLDTDHVTYEYTLSVDGEGKITDGAWLDGNHPESAWQVKDLPAIDGGFAFVRDLYEEAPLQ